MRLASLASLCFLTALSACAVAPTDGDPESIEQSEDAVISGLDPIIPPPNRTNPGVPNPPGAPAQVRLSEGWNSITVRWLSTGTYNRFFDVYWTETGGATHWKTADRYTPVLEITGLKPETEYCVKVTARNPMGSRSAPTVCGFTQPKPSNNPDLYMASASYTPASKQIGRPFTFSWQECNRGATAAPAYWTRVTFAGNTLGTEYRERLAPNACTSSRSYTVTPTSTSDVVKVLIDVDNRVAEVTERNNEGTL
jgi:hypothetical protein